MHLHLRFRRIVALVAGLLLTLSIHAQVITKSFRGVPLKTVLEEVEKQTGYSFLFESKEVDVDKPVTASFKMQRSRPCSTKSWTDRCVTRSTTSW